MLGTLNVIRLSVELMSRNQPNARGCRGVTVNTAGVEGIKESFGQVSSAAASSALIGENDFYLFVYENRCFR